MKNILKGSISVYLFNAYSNLVEDSIFISGSDRVGIKLIENEDRNVFVIAPKNFQKLLPEKINFISSDDLKFKNLYLNYVFRTFYTLYLLKNFGKKAEEVRIISTSDFFPDTIPAFLFSKKFQWYAFSYHLYPKNFSLRNILGSFLQNISFSLFQNAKKVIVTSFDCENFLKKNFRLTNITKVPLGIDLDSYSKKSSKIYDLIYLGRIKYSKGVFDLPEIIFNLKRNYPNIQINIIGNGSDIDVSKLKSEIKTYNLEDNINVLQGLSDDEVISYLQKSKILVQPSYEEGFGLSILEALACNLQIVAYNLPIYPEVFRDFDINLVKIGDKLAFWEALVICLSSNAEVKRNPDLFHRFSWKEIFNKIFYN